MNPSEPIITGPELDAEIAARSAEVDRTLLKMNLSLSLEQRLLQLAEQALLAEELDRHRLGTLR